MEALANSPTSFTPFPLLPAELRLKIWSLSIISLEPQTFRLTNRNIRKPRRHHVTTIHATAPTPAIFHANHEARMQAQEQYSQIPTIRVSPPRSVQDYPADGKYVWVNFTSDGFAVENLSRDIPYDPSDALKRIQRLKTVANDVIWFGENLRESHLGKLEGLMEIEFVLSEKYLMDHDAGKMVGVFDMVRKDNPEWNFPRTRIMEKGIVLEVYEGGVWTGEGKS